MNVLDFYKKKTNREKITMITCYDYTSARIVAETAIDCVLVGDSAAMMMHGYKDTLSATLDMMCHHVAAVSRGVKDKFIIADMPFLSYRKSFSANVTAVGRLMQAGAHAIKIECAQGNLKLIRHLTESGIPVMGHLGLTPQFVNMLGGYRVQGKTDESSARIKQDALSLQEAGCFSLVLECVPAAVAKELTAALNIATIGIGAGPDTDGQVLVFQDLLGLNNEFKPKFVKAYFNGFDQLKNTINHYAEEVKTGVFPSNEHSFNAN